MTDREEGIQNAIRFLSDPKVQQAPLAKRISFLEQKGLTAAEIQMAMNASGLELEVGQMPQISQNTTRSWSSIILGLASIGISGAGLLWAAKTYLGPYIDLPSAESAKRDNDLIRKQLEGSGKALDQVRLSTMDVIKGLDSHSKDVTASLHEMTTFIAGLKKAEETRGQEMIDMKRDIDDLKSTIPQLLENTSEAQATMLKEIRSEMKSLKSLFLNRRAADTQIQETNGTNVKASVFVPSFPGVNFNGKPTIPSWQLAAAAKGVEKPDTVMPKVAPLGEDFFETNNPTDNNDTDGAGDDDAPGVVEVDSDTSTDTAILIK